MKRNYFILRVLVFVSVLYAAVFFTIDWDSLTWTSIIALMVTGLLIYVIDWKMFSGIKDDELEKICFLPKGSLKEEE